MNIQELQKQIIDKQFEIGIEELQAINKKVKELEWLDE